MDGCIRFGGLSNSHIRNEPPGPCQVPASQMSPIFFNLSKSKYKWINENTNRVHSECLRNRIVNAFFRHLFWLQGIPSRGLLRCKGAKFLCKWTILSILQPTKRQHTKSAPTDFINFLVFPRAFICGTGNILLWNKHFYNISLSGRGQQLKLRDHERVLYVGVWCALFSAIHSVVPHQFVI